MADPRKSLADAIGARDRARQVFDEASAAVEGARAFVRDLAAKVATFATIDERIAAERTAAVKAALARGGVPSFTPSSELAAAVAAKAEAENQCLAARSALDELAREEAAAKVAFDSAVYDVSVAIEGVVRAEAEELAAEITRLETEVLQLRIQLAPAAYIPRVTKDGSHAWVQFSNEVVNCVRKNSSWPIAMVNTPEWQQAAKFSERWHAWMAELSTNCEARL